VNTSARPTTTVTRSSTQHVVTTEHWNDLKIAYRRRMASLAGATAQPAESSDAD